MSSNKQEGVQEKSTVKYPVASLPGIPYELRHEILLDVLVSSKPIFSISGLNFTDPVPRKVLAITRACRQLYWEAIIIYYSRNTFNFMNVSVLKDFLETIGQNRRQYVKNIRFTLCGPDLDLIRSATLLYQCVRLEMLTLNIERSPERDAWFTRYCNMRGRFLALADLRGLREVRVLPSKLSFSCLGGIARNLSKKGTDDEIVYTARVERLLRETVYQPRSANDKLNLQKV